MGVVSKAIKSVDGLKGFAVYEMLTAIIQDEFRAWVVVYNTATGEVATLAERDWALDVNSEDPKKRRASEPGPLKPPTNNPVLNPPFANAFEGNDNYSGQERVRTQK